MQFWSAQQGYIMGRCSSVVEQNLHKVEVASSILATGTQMPIYKTKNENFFKEWSPEMAYILGFFVADGSLNVNPRGSKYIDFCTIDKDLLYKVRKALGSNHKISVREMNNRNWNTVYRLQIGSKEMFKDLLKKGVRTDKTGHEFLPKMPECYFKDFLRGFFDGDGNVYVHRKIRKDRKNKLYVNLLTCFTCSNKIFLSSIKEKLDLITKGGTLCYSGKAWRLRYSTCDSGKLYEFMYNEEDSLFLKRKKNIFQKYINNNLGT